MKAWKQLIALNLVLVLLLSLFPGAVFAVDMTSEQEQTTMEQMQTSEVSEDVTLMSGDSLSFTKTDENYYPRIVLQAQENGYYRLRITPPESAGDVTIDGSYMGNADADMYLGIRYTYLDPIPIQGNGHDFVYFLSGGDNPSFQLGVNSGHEVQDNGEWTFSVDYIEPEPLELGVPIGADSEESFHVYTTELANGGYFVISAGEPANLVCSNGRDPRSWSSMQYLYQMNVQGTSDYFYVIGGTVMLACSQAAGSGGIVFERGNPHGDFGAEGDNLHWYLDSELGTLTISGTGSMGESVPWQNKSFRKLVIEPGVTDIAPEAFSGKSSLREASLPEGLEVIGDRAFAFCSDLKEIHIPSTVREIGDSAFEYTTVSRFELPASLSVLGDRALLSRGLFSVEADAANDAFQSADGVLYSRDGSTLICFPNMKSGPFCVPETVTVIGKDAFSGCRFLKSLYLPASLETLYPSEDCYLNLVNYGGTAEQWAAIYSNQFALSEGHVSFGCSASDYLGQIWQYELEDLEHHPVLSFTPEETGVYDLYDVSPSGADCFSGYASPGSMTVYVTQNGERQELLDGLNAYLIGGQTYELQAQPGKANYYSEYRPMTELGTFTFSAQKMAARPLSLGENRFQHSAYANDYYIFTAPRVGYYTLHCEIPEDSYFYLAPRTEGLYSWIDENSRGFLLKAGQTILVPVTGDNLEWIKLTVELQENALQGECGENLTWSIDSNGVLTIRGTGEMTNYAEYTGAPWYPYRDLIQETRVSEGVTSVGDNAFTGIEPTGGVSLPSTLRRIGNDAFFCNYGFTELTLPDGLEEIGDRAFLGCGNLNSVTIPDSVRSIGDGAFVECGSDLQHLRLPANLEHLGNGVLGGWEHRVIDLPETNEHFVKVDGILYDRDMTTVYYCDHSISGTVRLPESVREIRSYALSWSGAEKVIIPEGVQSIPYGICEHCSDLTEIRFPGTITERFGVDAVGRCTNLRDVYYDGSAAQWYQLTDDFREYSNPALTYHFAETSEAELVTVGEHSVTLTEQEPAAAYCFAAPEEGIYSFSADGCRIILAPEQEGKMPGIEFSTSTFVKLNAGEKLVAVLKTNGSMTGTFDWFVGKLQPSEAVLGDYVTETDTYRFVPELDGVYMISAWGSYEQPGMACVCDENLQILWRNLYLNDINGVSYHNLEAGKPIYLFWDNRSGTEPIHFSLHEIAAITAQPADQSVVSNTDAVFTVQARGESDLLYQWQSCEPGENEWKDVELPGADTDTLTFRVIPENDGQRFRCRIADMNGHEIVSQAAKLTVKTAPQTDPFTDVARGKFYYDAVLWATTQDPQITTGYANGAFRPDQSCTRAQVVTFLWRANGCPEPQSLTSSFKDVKDTSKYYYKAVLWASEQGITTGYSDGTFLPDAECSRGQVVTFLWRAKGQPSPTSTANPFKDVPAGKYFTTPVLWALEQGVTQGRTPTTFCPDDVCTRGHVVTFLYRAYN